MKNSGHWKIVLFFTILIYFSIWFVYSTVSMFIADSYYGKCKKLPLGKEIHRAEGYINSAIKFDSCNSKYYYERYRLLRKKYFGNLAHLTSDERMHLLNAQIKHLKKAIDLEPSSSAYHLFYAIALHRSLPRRSKLTKGKVKLELRKAVEVDGSNYLFRSILENYIKTGKFKATGTE